MSKSVIWLPNLKKNAKWLPKNVKWLHLGKKTKSKRVIWLQNVSKCAKWLHFGKQQSRNALLWLHLATARLHFGYIRWYLATWVYWEGSFKATWLLFLPF